MTFSARVTGTRASSLLAVLLLSGCDLWTRTVLVTPKAPVIPKPDRPVITVVSRDVLIAPVEAAVQKGSVPPATLTAIHDLMGTAQSMMTYARQLEASVDEYNAYAVRRNAETEEALAGAGDKKE